MKQIHESYLTDHECNDITQEATVVCVDNSEFTRNGDYAPTRFQAQADAVNLLAGAKTQHHPENTVGIMTMAGKTPQVLVTPTPDLGKVLNAMQEMKIEGEVNLSTAVQIAQLALKHRENKNQRQRIVVFVGSPIAEDKESLIKIGKKLKKNNVAVDVVSFGSEDENAEKLEAFYGAVNSNDNSHLVTVPAGTILSDMLFSTPIFMEEGGSGDGGAGGAAGGAAAAPRPNVVDGFDYSELGVDPNLDPELALALRISIEEERARQAAANPGETTPGEAPLAGKGQDADPAGPSEALDAPMADEGLEAMDEDTLLQQALALSMQTESGNATATPAATPYQEAKGTGGPSEPTAPTKFGEPNKEENQISSHQLDDTGLMEEDPELALALQMSLAQDQPDEKMEGEEGKEE